MAEVTEKQIEDALAVLKDAGVDVRKLYSAADRFQRRCRDLERDAKKCWCTGSKSSYSRLSVFNASPFLANLPSFVKRQA